MHTQQHNAPLTIHALHCSGMMLANEPAEVDIMERPPRRPGKRLLVRRHCNSSSSSSSCNKRAVCYMCYM